MTAHTSGSSDAGLIERVPWTHLELLGWSISKRYQTNWLEPMWMKNEQRRMNK